LAPVPNFNGKRFKCMFQISKTVYKIIHAAVQTHSFFRTKEFDCCGRVTIGLDVKILMALKVNAYGVAANSFCNYYQMGESMARKCCECFNKALSNCNELTYVYLCKMMKHDEKRIVKLHIKKHGVAGMLSLLDCKLFGKLALSLCKALLLGKKAAPQLCLR